MGSRPSFEGGAGWRSLAGGNDGGGMIALYPKSPALGGQSTVSLLFDHTSLHSAHRHVSMIASGSCSCCEPETSVRCMHVILDRDPPHPQTGM
jgi:hypothetical protein